MNIFQFRSYIDYLRAQIKEHQKVRGYQSRMAEAMGTHGSYLSRVLSGTVHLTLEQAFSLSQFWRLTKVDTEYWMNLVNYERAGTAELRQHHEEIMLQLRKQREEIENRLTNVKRIDANSLNIYYSSWHFSAIHMLLLMSNFQTVSAISQRLDISAEIVEESLSVLQELKIVKKRDRTWSVVETDIHMPNKGLFAPIFHSNWRQRMATRVFNQSPEELHYSSVYAMSRNDYLLCKEHLLQALDKIRVIVKSSEEEEIFYLGIDACKV
jgi:uncharacterized protein (TIGR02147 family)